jgi:hypothetical protein
MNTMIKESRKIAYDRCVSPKLKHFIDRDHIKNVCFEIYGEQGMKDCQVQNKFCGMCCKHHIGSKWFDILAKCNNQCENIIKKIDDKKIKQEVKKIESQIEKENDNKNKNKIIKKLNKQIREDKKKENKAIYG